MHKDKKITIQELKDAIGKFVHEREWEQFHSPKNLSMAIVLEAAELMEIFRFMSCQDSKAELEAQREKVSFELADITIATLSFCNLYNIDLSDAIQKKLIHNAQKYPVDKAKGCNKKYHHYQKIEQ